MRWYSKHWVTQLLFDPCRKEDNSCLLCKTIRRAYIWMGVILAIIVALGLWERL